MCLLAVLFRATDDAPLVVAANREEFYARGGDPPRRLDGVPAVGGVDPKHGGTWLGVNAHGLLVAVTNRRKSAVPSEPRSRGLLARELLTCGSAAAAAERAASELAAGRYDGCNFLCADADDCVVLHGGDRLDIQPLSPGVHVLSNRDVNDPTDERVRRVAGRLARLTMRTAGEALPALREVCASGDVCFRLAERGTVSSSLLALPTRLEDGIYLHAQGAPDATPYHDVSHLLRELRE
jgi:uncharacterized protein with NRDE domain